MSMTTILAPRSLRALMAWVITLTWVTPHWCPRSRRNRTSPSRADRAASLPVPAVKPVQAMVGADRRVEAGIFLGVAQAVDAVAHAPGPSCRHSNRARPLRAVPLGLEERLGDLVERLVPGCARTARSPSARCGAADAAAGRDGGCARHSARPWRRSRRRVAVGLGAMDAPDLTVPSPTSQSRSAQDSIRKRSWLTRMTAPG
jgi:hypothetical protein